MCTTPSFIAAKLSRAAGNLGAPLGSLDRYSDYDDDDASDLDDRNSDSDIVVYSEDPLSVGLGLEESLPTPDNTSRHEMPV